MGTPSIQIDNNNKDDKDEYKIVMLGSGGVGKTSIINQFLESSFCLHHQRTIEELHRHVYEICPDKKITLDFLDTSGSYPFPAMRDLYIKSGDAFILVFSVTDEESWKEVQLLREQLVMERGKGIPVIICANKVDVDNRNVNAVDVEALVICNWDHYYIETSAKIDLNIDKLFKDIATQLKIPGMENWIPTVRRRRSDSVADYSARRKSFPRLARRERSSCIVS